MGMNQTKNFFNNINNSCAWHGCIKCYPSDQDELPSGKTAGFVRERDQARMEFILTQIPRVHVIWECEIYRMLARDREMKRLFDECVDDGKLEIRDAFFGGRTGCMKAYHEAGPDQIIDYLDISSMYPYIKSVI